MPNGDPEFYVTAQSKLEAFFEPIASVLTDFARQHNVKLRKYYHQFPSWDFSFRHPRGGAAQVEVVHENNDTVSLACSWWYDDYETLTRFIKRSRGKAFSPDSQLLTQELEKALALILSWQFGTWDEHHSGMKQWRQFTKEQFEAHLGHYPEVTL